MASHFRWTSSEPIQPICWPCRQVWWDHWERTSDPQGLEREIQRHHFLWSKGKTCIRKGLRRSRSPEIQRHIDQYEALIKQSSGTKRASDTVDRLDSKKKAKQERREAFIASWAAVACCCCCHHCPFFLVILSTSLTGVNAMTVAYFLSSYIF